MCQAENIICIGMTEYFHGNRKHTVVILTKFFQERPVTSSECHIFPKNLHFSKICAILKFEKN